MREIFKHQIQRFNTTFFLDHNNLEDPTEYVDFGFKKQKFKFRVSNSFDSENLYVENYGNPLCSVSKEYGLIVVSSDDIKVSIKVFSGRKKRIQGTSWFTEKKSFTFLTVNKVNGDFYYGWNDNYQKKKSKTRFNKNCHTSSPILRISQEIKKIILNIDRNYHPEKVINETLTTFSTLLNLGDYNQFESSEGIFRSWDKSLLKFYLDRKKIKYPDNFVLFYMNSDIKIPFKLIRKSNMKVVDAFMSKYGFEGKVVKSAIHKTYRLNYILLKLFYDLFDKSWVNEDQQFVTNILNFSQTYTSWDTNFHLQKMTKSEKKKVFDIFKNFVITQKLDLFTVCDHIIIYNRLKEYGENELKWKSDDVANFREEHLDWTDKLEFYKNGDYFRIYPSYFYETINKEINSGIDIFFPILLNNTKNYNDESNTQFNCVKSYIGRSSSLIISLRKNEKNSSERATIEYSLTKNKEGKISVSRIQFLGKYNSKLSEEWIHVLLKLDQRVLSCVEDERFETVKIKKICSNGVEMFSDSDWNENGNLRWTYKNIE